MPDKKPHQQADIWTVLFNGTVEAIKMVFSVLLTIVIAGSKTTNSTTPSATSEGDHAAFRNGHSGPGYYDSNDQKL